MNKSVMLLILSAAGISLINSENPISNAIKINESFELSEAELNEIELLDIENENIEKVKNDNSEWSIKLGNGSCTGKNGICY